MRAHRGSIIVRQSLRSGVMRRWFNIASRQGEIPHDSKPHRVVDIVVFLVSNRTGVCRATLVLRVGCWHFGDSAHVTARMYLQSPGKHTRSLTHGTTPLSKPTHQPRTTTANPKVGTHLYRSFKYASISSSVPSLRPAWRSNSLQTKQETKQQHQIQAGSLCHLRLWLLCVTLTHNR
jgi:hypothetical protein